MKTKRDWEELLRKEYLARMRANAMQARARMAWFFVGYCPGGFGKAVASATEYYKLACAYRDMARGV